MRTGGKRLLPREAGFGKKLPRFSFSNDIRGRRSEALERIGPINGKEPPAQAQSPLRFRQDISFALSLIEYIAEHHRVHGGVAHSCSAHSLNVAGEYLYIVQTLPRGEIFKAREQTLLDINRIDASRVPDCARGRERIISAPRAEIRDLMPFPKFKARHHFARVGKRTLPRRLGLPDSIA